LTVAEVAIIAALAAGVVCVERAGACEHGVNVGVGLVVSQTKMVVTR
jgi:hypothetical protein